MFNKVVVANRGAVAARVLRALNAMGITPTDLISIIQAIKASGALAAEVEMM